MRYRNHIIVLVLLSMYVLIQFVVIHTYAIPFESDSSNYYKLAIESLNEGTYYPNYSSINSDYIIAPIYINALIILLTISQSHGIILIFNVILNVLQLCLIFLVTKKIFDLKSAIIALVLYMMYLNNLGLILLNYTELMFGVFIFSSIYLFLFSPKKILWLTSGFILGLALGVRPTAYALYVSYIFVYVVDIVKGKPNHRKFILVSLGLCLYIVIAGSLSYNHIRSFVFTSTTGPINLIMSANPSATGIYDPTFFEQDSMFATKKTFEEKGSYLKNKSVEYITSHPWHFISLLPRKIYSTYISDDWAVSILLNSNAWDLFRYTKTFKDPKIDDLFSKEPTGYRMKFLFINIYHQIMYMLIIGLILFQVLYFYKDILKNEGITLINCFIWNICLFSLISASGNLRFKYTFIIAGLILISPIVSLNIQRHYRKITNTIP